MTKRSHAIVTRNHQGGVVAAFLSTPPRRPPVRRPLRPLASIFSFFSPKPTRSFNLTMIIGPLLGRQDNCIKTCPPVPECNCNTLTEDCVLINRSVRPSLLLKTDSNRTAGIASTALR